MGQSRSFDPFDVTEVRRYICEMAAELADMAADIGDSVMADQLRAAALLRVRSLEDARRLAVPNSGQGLRRG